MTRGCGWVFGATLSVLGLYLLIHDSLILVHVIAPYGDGPAGVIAGPIMILFGLALMLWLRSTASVNPE